MLVIILLIAFVTAFTRFLPFIIFSKKAPDFIIKLGKILPPSLIAMIFIYSCKDIILSLGSDSTRYGIIGAISVCATLLIHIIFKNFILSVIGGAAFHIFMTYKFMQ